MSSKNNNNEGCGCALLVFLLLSMGGLMMALSDMKKEGIIIMSVGLIGLIICLIGMTDKTEQKKRNNNKNAERTGIKKRKSNNYFEVIPHTYYGGSTLNDNEVNKEKDTNNNMNGLAYEKYVADRLESMGYKRVNVTKSSGDFGADILAFRDGKQYCIQCKRYSKPVGLHAIQEVYSAKSFYSRDIAMVITTSQFTKAAKEFAEKTGVVLIENFE